MYAPLKNKNAVPKALQRAGFLIFYGWLLPAIPCYSQNGPLISYASLAEKAYLQLSNKVFTTGQTIWFKAIVSHATDHTPTQISGVLYTELIDPNENIIEKKLVKIVNGTGDGFFQLSPSYPYGTYQVRAYTQWNNNFGSKFLFSEYILVSGMDVKTDINLIRYLTLIETQENRRSLSVTLDPTSTDSIAGSHIAFMISVDDKKDTVLVKKNRKNQYLLDYTIPAKGEILTVQVQDANQMSYSKTIVLDTNYLDIQFFPESGEWVQGLPSVLGFKAIGYDGKGKQIQGEVVNEKGEVVASIKTNRLGMGSTRIESADSAAHYSARIVAENGHPREYRYSLPAVAAKGNILELVKDRNAIKIIAYSNYLRNDSITIRVTCRGVLYYDIKGSLKKGKMEYSLADSSLPEGIINFTLLVHSFGAVAERLYFNQRPDKRITVTITANKTEYDQRDETRLIIETKTAGGKPEPANISLLAFTTSAEHSMLDFRQNILSYFLLSSELKGEIESPGFYFTKETDRFQDLDALLLTQGWRKYNYTREPVNFSFQPEENLTVTGQVKGGLFDKKRMTGAALTLASFGKNPTFDKQNTDSVGRFRFTLKDDYGPNVKVLIQTANKSNKNRNYTVELDPKPSPPVLFNHVKLVEKPDSIIRSYIRQNYLNKRTEDSFRIAAEGFTLQEVVVNSSVLSPEQKKVTERYGKPRAIITGEAIRKSEEKWSYGLYSVLMFKFPEKVRIRRIGGVLFAELFNRLPTLVVIDGIPVMLLNYSLIPNIPPSEVKSFEIIENASNFSSLFCEVVPRLGPIDPCANGGPAFGNVIAIYTHAGKGLFATSPTIGLTKNEVPVFDQPREFYAPKYTLLTPEDWLKPDLRNVLHWQPVVQVDSTGRMLASYYNSDNTGTMKIIVEAITAGGELGYGELLYEVKKKKK